MPRRVNSSQLRNELRRLQQKQRKAINDYNREVRRVNNHNKRVIDNYNREVRAYNAKRRANRQKLINELNLLRSSSGRTTSVRYTVYYKSVATLHQSFERLEQAADTGAWSEDAELFDMAEGETANSVAVLNALLDKPSDDIADDRPRQTVITSELTDISIDLDSRWRGALFALSPQNPDAARQFCTSCREILVKILDLKAPDKTVLAVNPEIKLMNGNQVPRREKIYYILSLSGLQSQEFVNFVDDDINNVMDLFGDLNSGTHGEAGRYDLHQLSAIKTRVEGAITFLHRIVS